MNGLLTELKQRGIILVLEIITCIHIIANVWRHW